jgi:hypothetical protein
VELASDACLFEINLNVFGARDLFGLVAVETHADELVARKHPRPLCGGASLDAPGDDAMICVGPFNTIPRRCLVSNALAKVEQTGADQ